MRPHPVLGQKILHPKRPHGAGNGAAETDTGTGTGALVGDLVGALVGDLVGTGQFSFFPPLVFSCLEVVALQTLGSLPHLNNEAVFGVVLDSVTPISVDVKLLTAYVIVPPPYDKNSKKPFGPLNPIPFGPPFGKET
jgi:hypothetical protein